MDRQICKEVDPCFLIAIFRSSGQRQLMNGEPTTQIKDYRYVRLIKKVIVQMYTNS